MAEAVKKEKKLFPTEDDRYRPLGFKIKYRVGGDKIQKLKIIGHLWDRRLEIISQGADDVVEAVSPQVEKEIVKLIIYFRDYFF
jgi:hypothetical protein